MCVIMVKPLGVPALKEEWLDNAVQNNRDGWGLLIRDKAGAITVKKGFTDETFIKDGSSYGEDFEVVAHARISTGGAVNMKNLHPFPIFADHKMLDDEKAEPEAYLFHNGIITSIQEWDKSYNDTWHLARVWETSYGSIIGTKMRQRGWRRRQKNFLGSYNKFVLVDKNGYSIINPNAGKWVDGVWHSNDTALKPPNYTSYSCYGSYDDDLPTQSYSQYLVKAKGDWVKQENGTYTWKENYGALTPPAPKVPVSTKQQIMQSFNAPKKGHKQSDAVTEVAEALVDEWLNARTLDDIEDSIFNYDSYTVANAVALLLKRTGNGLPESKSVKAKSQRTRLSAEFVEDLEPGQTLSEYLEELSEREHAAEASVELDLCL